MRNVSIGLALALAIVALPLAAETPPPLPRDAPTLMLGTTAFDGAAISEHHVTFAMGRAAKTGPLSLGEKIAAGALQESVLEKVETDRGTVLRRTSRIRRAGSDQVLAEASIELDPHTLRPLFSKTVQGGQESTVEYDWESFTIRRSSGDEVSLDLEMLEVGAHDVWMAALPLTHGFTARLPAVFASTGTKYWAVPRVVGSEKVDVGDGVARDAWVVELDWWGMGAANTADNYSPGGGANDTGGTGGKYWVLDQPVAGQPSVVRVRTQVDDQTDSVIQLQALE